MNDEKTILNHKIDFEETKLYRMNQIKEEINNMNRNLNNCIDIVSSSSISPKTHSTFEYLKQEAKTNNDKTNNDLDYMIDITKSNINNLRNVLEEKEKDKEEENDEEKEENE